MEASPVTLAFLLFSLSVLFFSPTPRHLSPPPALRTSRFSCRSAAEEKNVDNEIKGKVCRFAGDVIRKASGGLGGLQSRVQSKHLARVSGSFIFLFFTF